MFFRREKPQQFTFAERIEGLKKFGFAATLVGSNTAKVSRDGIAAVIDGAHVEKAGLAVGDDIGQLVNGGYQMFWKTATGKRVPAQAAQLKNLHAFEEDLKEGLGLVSLYNQGLGTTSEFHMYDRVEHRDAGDEAKPWDHKPL